MALGSNYDGLVGVRSGAGVVDGCTLTLTAADVTLTLTAGQIKTHLNDATKLQRLNEGGDIVAVSSQGLNATGQTIGKHFLFVSKTGTFAMDAPGSTTNIVGPDAAEAPGPMMNAAKLSLKMNSGSVCVGAAEVYDSGGAVLKWRNITYDRRETA